jgi:hypothetical protein
MVLAGSGDQAAMARYCQARADRDADLTHLVMREGVPSRRVKAVVFRSGRAVVAGRGSGLPPRSPSRSVSGSPHRTD